MSAQLIYWIFLLACSAYVLWKGGPPERLGIAIAIAASFLSAITVSHDLSVRYRHVETGLFTVDLVTLAAFAILALRSDRFWPLWITGIHLVGVATHTAKLLTPEVVPRVYSWIQGLWAYPIVLLIVIGAWRHQERLRRFGADNSWTGSSGSGGRRRRRPGPET